MLTGFSEVTSSKSLSRLSRWDFFLQLPTEEQGVPSKVCPRGWLHGQRWLCCRMPVSGK